MILSLAYQQEVPEQKGGKKGKSPPEVFAGKGPPSFGNSFSFPPSAFPPPAPAAVHPCALGKEGKGGSAKPDRNDNDDIWAVTCLHVEYVTQKGDYIPEQCRLSPAQYLTLLFASFRSGQEKVICPGCGRSTRIIRIDRWGKSQPYEYFGVSYVRQPGGNLIMFRKLDDTRS